MHEAIIKVITFFYVLKAEICFYYRISKTLIKAFLQNINVQSYANYSKVMYNLKINIINETLLQLLGKYIFRDGEEGREG